MNKASIFKLNISEIIKTSFKIGAFLLSSLSIFLTFVTFEEIGINKTWIKIIILIAIFIFSFLLSSVIFVFFFKKKKIWHRGKNSVVATYGDILQFAFSSKIKEKRIVVIPVNDYFDTIVEEPGEDVIKTLVAPTTIHGMWIKQYLNRENIKEETLRDRINKSLSIHGFNGEKVSREKGNQIKYSLGDVAIIDGQNNCVFYLLAISKFDENNNAHVSKKELRDCIELLLDFYDKNGQSIPIYIPLMGTGSSRAGLTHESSLKVIKSCVLTSEEKINGCVNIIVYKKDKDKVSIFK